MYPDDTNLLAWVALVTTSGSVTRHRHRLLPSKNSTRPFLSARLYRLWVFLHTALLVAALPKLWTWRRRCASRCEWHKRYFKSDWSGFGSDLQESHFTWFSVVRGAGRWSWDTTWIHFSKLIKSQIILRRSLLLPLEDCLPTYDQILLKSDVLQMETARRLIPNCRPSSTDSEFLSWNLFKQITK